MNFDESKIKESFERVLKLDEWTASNKSEVDLIKNSFWHKRDFWEQEPQIANAVSDILFGFEAIDIDEN